MNDKAIISTRGDAAKQMNMTTRERIVFLAEVMGRFTALSSRVSQKTWDPSGNCPNNTYRVNNIDRHPSIA